VSDEYPFGDPDGARAPVHELISEFLPFTEANLSSGVDVRVISGPKGSGKTVALRRIHVAIADNHSVYTDVIRAEPPPSEQIVRFAHQQRQAGHVVDEEWVWLWRRAILRSLATHLIHGSRGTAPLCPDAQEALSEYTGKLLPATRRPRSVYDEVSSLITSRTKAVHRTLHDPAWTDIEAIIGELLQHTRPIYFFVDSSDEWFQRAPRDWLEFQKALIIEISRILRHPVLGGRLHVFTALRDVALAAAMRGPHGTRLMFDARIRSINWDYRSIKRFLHMKIERLPERFLLDPANHDPIARWLGRDVIHNERRGIDEKMLDYLIRHTRLLPRDIVVLGNRICGDVAAARQHKEPMLSDARIREGVSDAARRFGNEQLAICADEVSCEMMPPEAAATDPAFYIANNYFSEQIETSVRALILALQTDHVEGEQLRQAVLRARSEFSDVNVFTVLWKNGMIGYVERNPAANTLREVFFDGDSRDSLHFPLDREEYVFHPCLIDSVGIRGVGVPTHVGRAT
jgi:hypothetical protein